MSIAHRDVPDRERLDDTLGSAVDAIGLSLSANQRGRLLDYVAMLAKWNRTYNLTAVRDPGDMLVQHVVDCLAALPPACRQVGSGRVLDVGSGGGLPGVVWAIAQAHYDVTCVDSVGKKAAFVRQVAATLGVDNLHALHGRVEGVRQPFDLIVARAFATLKDFVECSSAALSATGRWAAMKGKMPTAEIEALPSWVEVFHVEPLVVPGLDAERCIIWMRRRENSALLVVSEE